MKNTGFLAAAATALIVTFGCSAQPVTGTTPTLVDTRWELSSIEQVEYSAPADQQGVYLQLDGQTQQLRSFAGCNNAAGGYTLAGNKFSVGLLAVTLMACADDMDLEQQYLAALGRAERFEIDHTILRLYAADELLLEFQTSHP
jgi:heat shock protein HslJ